MANNRMWIVHRPTGVCQILAKRMAVGWYHPHHWDGLGEFWTYLEDYADSQDDLLLVHEGCFWGTGTSQMPTEWDFVPDDTLTPPLRRLKWKENDDG